MATKKILIGIVDDMEVEGKLFEKELSENLFLFSVIDKSVHSRLERTTLIVYMLLIHTECSKGSLQKLLKIMEDNISLKPHFIPYEENILIEGVDK